MTWGWDPGVLGLQHYVATRAGLSSSNFSTDKDGIQNAGGTMLHGTTRDFVVKSPRQKWN